MYFDRKVNYDGSNDCMHVNLCGLVEQRLQPDCVKAYVYTSQIYMCIQVKFILRLKLYIFTLFWVCVHSARPTYYYNYVRLELACEKINVYVT